MTVDLTLSPFRGDEDYASLAAIQTASENADCLPVTITAMDIAERLSHTPRLDIFRDLIIAGVNGQAVGWDMVHWWEVPTRRAYGLAGCVMPEWRGKGIGRAVLGWQEARAGGIARENPGALPAFLRVNTTQYQAGLQALVRAYGYTVKESWVLMIRPRLEDIPDWPLPEELEVRPVLPEQLGEIWYAVCEAYVPVGGPPPEHEFPEDLKNDPNFQPELGQVAWEVSSGKVVGSVMTYIDHAENQQLGIRRGYTEGISTVPGWQRRGVARALIVRSLKIQRAEGMTESALVCSGENLDNYRLYSGCGFQEVKHDTVYEKPLVLGN